MKLYKNINELVESLTKDIITDKYEIYCIFLLIIWYSILSLFFSAGLKAS